MRIIHSTLDWVRIRAADNSRGILLMAGGTLLATATLVFIRLLGRDLPTAEIIFLRYAFALLAIAPWILRVGIGNTFATSRPRLRLHGIRGAIATISTGAWYYAITVVPLAQALALNCLAAIFVTIGAVVFLGEKADARRWTAVLTGLFGAWIILRPGFQAVSTGSMIVVCSAVGYGATMLFIKVLARTDSPLTIVAYLYVFNVIYSAIPAALVWETPSLTHVVWLVIIGLLSSLGHAAPAPDIRRSRERRLRAGPARKPASGHHRRRVVDHLRSRRVAERDRRSREPHHAEILIVALNPADYSVISQALIAATHEMGAKLVRSAYSTIVREASDASAALLDPNGQAVAQAELMIQQLGSLSATFGPCAEHHPVDTLVEGDFYINNDPYHGGQHLPDVFIFSPVFFEGELVAFGATVAHHIDIGGGAPGLNVNAREIYQEGLIIPPSRYNLDDDWNGGRLERLIATNVRVPDQTIGDMNAQFAGNAIGAARVRQLCRKYGPEAVKETMASLIDYSERRMRAAIAAAPDGVYHGEDVIDNDWAGGGPVHVRVAVTIDGDEVAIDFDGTSDQVGSNMNAPFASTVAAAFGCVKAVLTSADIPYNAGSTRPATVTAPYGSLLNPRPPAAVRARMTATNRAFNAVMKALARAVPEKVIATGFDTTTGPYLSRRSESGYKVYHEVIGGGYGASARADGCSGVDGPLGNCSNVPVESLDMDFDFFRVREYSLIPDSGGGGAFRGGLGIRRRYEILADEVQYAQYGDRFRFQPDGLFGGEPGAAASCNIERDGAITELASKESAWLRSGDVLTVSTGGGGGYGAPDRRSAERIDDDARQRRISARPESSLERRDAEFAK